MQIYSDKCFKNPIETIEAKNEQLKTALNKIDKLRKKYHLIGYITYDFSELYFEVYDKYEKYTPKAPKKLGTIIKPRINKKDYIDNIKKIKNYIKNGYTYEVNYTYPSTIYTNLDKIDLYEAILEKQTTPYNFFFETPQLNLLSFSPELFFKLNGNKIITKPMKGTIKRGSNKEEDKKNKQFLYNDLKNRA